MIAAPCRAAPRRSLFSHLIPRRSATQGSIRVRARQVDATIVREYRKADQAAKKFRTVLSNPDRCARKVHLASMPFDLDLALLMFSQANA